MLADRIGPVLLGAGAIVCAWTASVLPQGTRSLGLGGHHGTVNELLLAPTVVQWRRPVGEFPELARVLDGHSTEHGGLPIVSLRMAYDDLFNPERGIYAIGNAMLHDQGIALRYMHDPKWWKYPGNYFFRGKEWERTGNIEIFDGSGERICNEQVGIRINGNTTRGFPQKALRVVFNGKERMPLFTDAMRSYDEIVLRASGNDQDRTMFRDALQHRLCEGLPFDVSRAVQSVLYINGAYWGIHNMRERVEDDELALRYGLKKKDIVILADRALPYRNDDEGKEAKRFKVWLRRLERMDATGDAFTDSLSAAIDVDGFLNYMAAQIIFGNTDWPDQNVKFWRFTGPADASNAKTDGRWRFIMGDSDLGFGYAEVPPGKAPDMFHHLAGKQGPVARLFRACLSSPRLSARFGSILHSQLDGPLSAERMVAMVQRMAGKIDTEMYRHVRRWRRPQDHAEWEGHVNWMVTFAHNRPDELWKQWQDREQH